MKKPSVLHGVSSYLPNTENWLYRLIKFQPANRYVAAHEFLDCHFYLDDVTYLRSSMPYRRPGILGRSWNRLLKKVDSDYEAEILPMLLSAKLDVMHSHFAHIGWQYQSLANALKLPHIISFYGMDYEQVPYLQPIWKKRYQAMFKATQLFVCEGSHGASALEKLGCPPEKIAVSKLGVDVAEIPFFSREKHTGELKLVQIASLREKKGHAYTVRAFALALKQCPEMSLTLVGSGNEERRNDLLAEIEKAGLHDKIRVLEEIDFSRLHEFLADFHVFIHPSCHTADKDCEGGAPVVLLDAQATGMPVISTLHCDIPEEVIHRETGLLSPERDVEKLSGAIIEFYQMPQEIYSRYCENARLHVAKNYDAKTNAENLSRLYVELAEKNMRK